jgi:YD repeat-containing protein
VHRLTSTDALNHTTSDTCDSMNRLTVITAPDTTTQFAYNYRARRTSVTDAVRGLALRARQSHAKKNSDRQKSNWPHSNLLYQPNTTEPFSYCKLTTRRVVADVVPVRPLSPTTKI